MCVWELGSVAGPRGTDTAAECPACPWMGTICSRPPQSGVCYQELGSRRSLQAQVASTQPKLMGSEIKCHLHVLWFLRSGANRRRPVCRQRMPEVGVQGTNCCPLPASVSLGAGSVLEGQPAMTGQVGVLTSHRTPHPPAEPLTALFGWLQFFIPLPFPREAGRS